MKTANAKIIPQGFKGQVSKRLTHEAYIQAVRNIALAYLQSEEDRAAVSACKLVYGAGNPSLRGVTYFNRWKNGEPLAFAEICAFGESNHIQLAGTTLHELGHVLAGPMGGHAKPWAQACNKLGLRFVRAAGTRYSWACFAPSVRLAIASLGIPKDGAPSGSGVDVHGAPLQLRLRPCIAGQGTRGGISRGIGSGSRLRKFTCDCGNIIRAGRDDARAKCLDCGTDYKPAQAERIAA